MHFKKRCFLLALISVAFLALWYFGGLYRLKADNLQNQWRQDLPLQQFVSHLPLSAMPIPPADFLLDNNKCRMSTCFNFTKCPPDKPFKVYVYPDQEHIAVSQNYAKILDRIRKASYYTENPQEACLFVLSIDTLDRDPRSNVDYVRNLQANIGKLQPFWNGGTNHLVFNLFSGTYPDYLETALDFDVGRAILAKASMSDEFYRSGFDVSLPLFGGDHPARGSDAILSLSNPFPVAKKHTLAFKGKRYLYGIGSETRNSLYHLHNGQDVVLVTTCRHGKDWVEHKDERCDEDNQEYDRWDYDQLLSNSTFCLVPRGRRLGSFRFLETLRAGCVPVLLSNGWRLPFAEVIDWSEAVIEADERLLLQVPEIIHSVSRSRVFAMRQQTQVLYDRYLSSVEKIVDTTIEIIKQRIRRHQYQEGLVWNTHPGALLTLDDYSDHLTDLPFDYGTCNRNEAGSSLSFCDTNSTSKSFTAVIYTQLTSTVVHLSAPIFKLARNVAASGFVDKIIVIWTADKAPPPTHQWPFIGGRTNVPIEVIHQPGAPITTRFSIKNIRTEAILSLDDDAALTTEEMDFAFQVWKQFPDRLVGFPSRSHYWDDRKHKWVYTSKWGNDYSMILTGAAFYHRYYNALFTKTLSPSLQELVDAAGNCEDILMNFLVSHVTRRPPIKVTQRKQYKETSSSSGLKSPWSDPGHFAQRQTCINTFTAVFGYMPLLKSATRFDPVLYKDAVSNARKKYRKLELVPIHTGSKSAAAAAAN